MGFADSFSSKLAKGVDDISGAVASVLPGVKKKDVHKAAKAVAPVGRVIEKAAFKIKDTAENITSLGSDTVDLIEFLIKYGPMLLIAVSAAYIYTAVRK